MRLVCLLHLEAEVEALAREDLDAAEVDVGTNGVRLGLVERSDLLAVRSHRALVGLRCRL